MTPDLLVTNLLGNALLGAVGVTLLHFVWQGALLALGLALLLRILRPERAELRYAFACGVLLLMVAAPLATFGGLYGGSSPVTNPAMLEPLIREGEPVNEARNEEALTPAPVPAQQVAPATLVAEAPRPLETFYSLYASLNVGRFAPYLTLLWGLGVLLLTLRLLGGVWVSARLGRRGQLAPARYQRRLLELSHHLGLRESVRLLESSAVAVPVVAGWLKPVILLPSSALSGLTPLQLEMILAHELAHVRRRDPLVNALQHLVETALFYHPAVWWVSRVMRQERESCCDDIATRLCGDPLAYAETLARLERLRSPSPLVLAGSGGRLKNRIERLVGVQGKPSGSPLVTFGLAVGLVGLLGVAGVLAQSGGAVPDASPVVPLTLPERSLWVDILGDVTFTDDYKNIADVGEDGLFVLEERRNRQPYRLLVVMSENNLPLQTTAETIEYSVAGSGGPSFIYAEGGDIKLKKDDSGNFTAVEGAELIILGDLNDLKTDRPEIARWLQGGLEQTVARVANTEDMSKAIKDPSVSLALATGTLENGQGFWSLFKGPISPLPAYIGRLSEADEVMTLSDRSEFIASDLQRALHYTAHNLVGNVNALGYIRDLTEHFATDMISDDYMLMLQIVAQLSAESPKADALVAIAKVLPEDMGLREEYRRVAGTIEDEALQRRALDALTTPQGSTGLEVVLDAGHGGVLRGASGYADEDEVVLAVAEKVAARLAAAGVKVVMTRESDTALGDTPTEDLDARLARITPDTAAFISLHANASDNSLTKGTETFVASNFETEGLEAATLALAGGLQAELVGADAPSKGVNRSPYYLLERASVPAVIVELGYVTNPEEGAKLTTEAYQDTLAEAISRAVLTFLQIDEQPGVRGSVPGLEEVYRALAETMNRARLLFPHAEDAPFGSQNPVQPLYDEARAYCNGEKTVDGVFDTYFTMLTARPDADTDFFIKPDVENLVQTCVERFITDSDFRERFRNPSERDFLLDR